MPADNYIVYKLWSTKKPEMVYIGITNNIIKRRSTHFSIAYGSYTHKYYNKPLYVAIRNLGKDSFIMEILEEGVLPEKIKKLERDYILTYGSLYPQGYNLL